VAGSTNPRIVSTIASATEIVHALGLGGFQVGRSHECDWPPQVRELPVCTRPRFDIHGNSAEIDQRVKDTLRDAGSVYEILADVLDPLAPTHILTQTQCKVCAVTLEDVEAALSQNFASRPQVVALEPNRLSDIYRDITRISEACGTPKRGKELVEVILASLDNISSRAKSSPRQPSVACIEWPEPMMAAGNWVPELVELAGGRPVFGQAGEYSPYLRFDELMAADPEVIILMPCGYGLEKCRAESHWLTSKTHWVDLQAARNQRFYLCDANQYMTRPGPRVVDSVQALAEMLHPELFEPTLEGVVWEACGR
jgi:iron complex transport system substrate-binding protein